MHFLYSIIETVLHMFYEAILNKSVIVIVMYSSSKRNRYYDAMKVLSGYCFSLIHQTIP